MAAPLRIAGIVGSLRRDSLNRALFDTMVELAPPGLKLEPVDVSTLPFYNADFESDGVPAPVAAYRKAIAEADAVLIVTPEYNHGVPALVKNAIDVASRPPGKGALGGKPVAIAGASPGTFGTVRAQVQLRAILHGSGANAFARPEVLVSLADQKIAGGRVTDASTREHIVKFLTALEAHLRA